MTLCRECGAELKQGAKFCGSCGKPVPQQVQAVARHLTTQEVLEWLEEQGSSIDDDLYFLERPVQQRTQGVVVLVALGEDDDTAYDSLTLWSAFAPAKVNTKKALEVAAAVATWGVCVRGETLELQNLLFVESLTSIDELERYVDWLAIQADKIEEILTGKDTF